MLRESYFDPNNANHTFLLSFLEKNATREGEKINVVKFGTRTQHLFSNGAYQMTINWGLV